jgi:hypothetical protein
VRLSTIPGADDRDALLLELVDGDLYLTARVEGAHTSVQVDVKAVDRLIRDLQHWRFVNESAPTRRYYAPRWEDTTPHFSIDEDGKVTQLLPLQRRVNDLAHKLLQVEMGHGWPMHATEEVAHHSYVPPNTHRPHPYRTVVLTPDEAKVREAFEKAARRALGVDEDVDLEVAWRDAEPMTREAYTEAVAKLCEQEGFELTGWQRRFLEQTLNLTPDGLG